MEQQVDKELMEAIRKDHPELADIPDNELYGAILKDHPEIAPPQRTMMDEVKNFGSNLYESSLKPLLHLPYDLTHHPIDTVKGIATAQDAERLKAIQHFKNKNYGAAAAHGLDYLLPVIGPGIGKAQDQMARGDWSGGLGTSVGTGLVASAPSIGKYGREGLSTLKGKAADLLQRDAERTAVRGVGGINDTNIANLSPYAADLVERNVAKLSRAKTDTMAFQNRLNAGKMVREMADRVPLGKMVNRSKLQRALSEMIERGKMDNGVVLNPEQVKAATQIYEELSQFPESIPFKDLNRYLKGKDAALDAAGKYDSSAANAVAQQAALGPVRAARAEAGGPDLVKANKEFEIYSTVTDAIENERPELRGLSIEDKIRVASTKPYMPKEGIGSVVGSRVDDIMVAGGGLAIGGPKGALIGEGLNLGRQWLGAPQGNRLRSGIEGGLARKLGKRPPLSETREPYFTTFDPPPPPPETGRPFMTADWSYLKNPALPLDTRTIPSAVERQFQGRSGALGGIPNPYPRYSSSINAEDPITASPRDITSHRILNYEEAPKNVYQGTGDALGMGAIKDRPIIPDPNSGVMAPSSPVKVMEGGVVKGPPWAAPDPLTSQMKQAMQDRGQALSERVKAYLERNRKKP